MAAQRKILGARFGDFVADFGSFELRRHGTRVKLQDQPFQILKLLVQRAGELVTREELCTELWPDSTFVDFDAGLNAAVRRLRDALCDSAEDARYIQTVPRHGYRFIAPIEILSESVPLPPKEVAPGTTAGKAEIPESAPVQRADVSAPLSAFIPSPQVDRPGLWIRSLVVGCVLLLVLALGAMVLRPKVLAKRPNEASTYSLAVLPLQNLSGDPAEEYFADGMTDALITNLAQSNSLKVISSTSSMRYKNAQKGLREIGRELNVGLVLEGSVARSGSHVRVSTQLVDAGTDEHLWARQYDRDLRDVLQLQNEIASAVAVEVTGKLAPVMHATLPTGPLRVNPAAYEAYLKGKYFLDKWTEAGFQKSKTYFEDSIERDPSFVDAYTGLAEYYATMGFMGVRDSRESWLKAEELIAKTLAVDERSVKAHTLLGMIKWQFRCDREGAKKELEYALQLNPSEMGALDNHSYYLLETGHTSEAIAEKQAVLQHDPLSVRTNAELGLYFLNAQRPDEAILRLQKTLELDPNYAPAHMRLGLAYSMKKEYEQAVDEI
jgi:TolB-like protein/DNA-binding winged helix-turn-helix (wHTH) protein/Tfp pilus assembly protein PilF